MRGYSSTGRGYLAPARRVPPDLPLGLMDLSLGLIYILSPHKRLSSPSLDIARRVLFFLGHTTSIRVWGAFFVGVGIFLCYAVYRREQWAVSFVRVIGPAICFMWALMYLLSGFESDLASFAGVPVFLYLTYRHSFAPVRRETPHDSCRS